MKRRALLMGAPLVLLGCQTYTPIEREDTSSSTLGDKDIDCLTDNVYHEARGEPYLGRLLVTEVVLNRLRSALFPSTVCGVIYQPYQFSWTLTEPLRGNPELWERLREEIVEEFTRENRKPLTDADHYHADYIEAPYWTKKMEKVAHVGHHIFYKM